jgi:hypothetical protein
LRLRLDQDEKRERAKEKTNSLHQDKSRKIKQKFAGVIENQSIRCTMWGNVQSCQTSPSTRGPGDARRRLA